MTSRKVRLIYKTDDDHSTRMRKSVVSSYQLESQNVRNGHAFEDLCQ